MRLLEVLVERLLFALFGRIRPRDFTIELWNGARLPAESGRPSAFVAIVRDSTLLWRVLSRPDLATLGEAYVTGALEVRGDLRSAYTVANRFTNAHPTGLRSVLDLWSSRPAVFRRSLRLWKPGTRVPTGDVGTLARSREAVNYHYELPRRFFETWLDDQMIYSCAYYVREGDSLDVAQRQKLDHVCRKLVLRKGERFLDVGCGWGALVVHASREYGVHATGITLSEKQAAHARERIDRAGLSDRCQIVVSDFRELPGNDTYDKIASVGMSEHVPRATQPQYFRRLWSLLRNGGLLLNHAIGCTPVRPLRSGNTFLQRHIFPDHELFPIHETLSFAEAEGFEVRDVENLREHYAATLAMWAGRLDARAEQCARLVGEQVVRAFRVYMLGMAHHFEEGNLHLYQSLLAKSAGGPAEVPRTRAHIYRRDDERNSLLYAAPAP